MSNTSPDRMDAATAALRLIQHRSKEMKLSGADKVTVDGVKPVDFGSSTDTEWIRELSKERPKVEPAKIVGYAVKKEQSDEQ